MRFLTAGESHGEALAAIIEGFPKGVRIEASFIDSELKRRMKGFGRGKRMAIENDKVHIISGMRNKVTLGSPIAMLVRNKDHNVFTQDADDLKKVYVPRPGHADLAGYFKYAAGDLRNILERSSARETAARVCVGAVCKQFLSCFAVKVASFVTAIGKVSSDLKPKSVSDILKKTNKSAVSSIDSDKERLMMRQIDKARKDGDTLGGVLEVWAQGVPPGIGSCMHFDARLDAKIAGYIMSIPSVKAVEIGAGFDYAGMRGRKSHDGIFLSNNSSGRLMRKTNNSGGIEGGISNGEILVVRVGVKPVPTLVNPLPSVNILNKRKEKASVIRSDTCIVEAAGVIAENMIAIALTEAFLDKFGSDSLREIKRNYKSYIKRNIPARGS
ncbi:MAG: chorismate synthase [Candidatus Omnitrophica bacterium 4484_171]|nr:MAG: chorismate synthase [Candidatus Omnitrophica bacterium 4484_171]